MTSRTITAETARDWLEDCLHDDLATVLAEGYEVYVVPPRRPLPNSTTKTGWFYVTESLADNRPLATVSRPSFPMLGQPNGVSSSLTPSRKHGSGMIIRGQDEGEHLGVLEALEKALVEYPSNSFQRNIGVRNPGAKSISLNIMRVLPEQPVAADGSALSVGDLVEYATPEGDFYGQITQIHEDNSIDVEGRIELDSVNFVPANFNGIDADLVTPW